MMNIKFCVCALTLIFWMPVAAAAARLEREHTLIDPFYAVSQENMFYFANWILQAQRTIHLRSADGTIIKPADGVHEKEQKIVFASRFFAENDRGETPMHRIALSVSLPFFKNLYAYWGAEIMFHYLAQTPSSKTFQPPLMGLVTNRDCLTFLLCNLPHNLRADLITFKADEITFVKYLKTHSENLCTFVFLVVSKLKPCDCAHCMRATTSLTDELGVEKTSQSTDEIVESLSFVYRAFWENLLRMQRSVPC